MIVQMDNNKPATSSWERAQKLFDRNVGLENRRRKSAEARIPSDPNAWYQMRENYEAIILEDLGFTEKHDIEYTLWLLHYKRIEEFRAHLSAAQGSGRSASNNGGKGVQPDRLMKIRVQFKTFLSEATGFYHDLIVKIRSTYGLPVGLSSDNPDIQTVMGKTEAKSNEMKKALVCCHRCLIYLGDLARYKGQYADAESRNRDFAAASSYYLQAVALCPSSGNPHHQLAILASYAGDELVAVYRHFRSLAAEIAFPTAKDNLVIVFEKNRQIYSQLHAKLKSVPAKGSDKQISAKGIENKEVVGKAGTGTKKYKEFCIQFVRLNGILFTRTSLEMFMDVLSSVKSALQGLLSSGLQEEQNFGTDATENALAVVRLIAIIMFTYSTTCKKSEGQSYADCLQHTVLVQNASTMTYELVGLLIGRCLQLQDVCSSFLLPGILTFLEWLACFPHAAARNDADNKPRLVSSSFWDNCVAFLNKLLSSGLLTAEDEGDETCFTNMCRYEDGENEIQSALWEDFELRGFLPIVPAQTILDFSRKSYGGPDGSVKEKRIRVRRIISAGKVLASLAMDDQKPVYYDTKIKQFVIGVEPQLHSDSMLNSVMGGNVEAHASDSPGNSVDLTPPGKQAQGQLFNECEEEEEEIVFKPSLTEKLPEAAGLNLSTSSNLEPSQSFPMNNEVHYQQMMADARQDIGIPSVVSSHQQYRPPVNSLNAFQMKEETSRLINRLSSLGIVENGNALMPETRGLGISAAESRLPPFQQSVNVENPGAYSSYRKGTENPTALKADPAWYHEGVAEIFAGKTEPNMLSSKVPICRPVRHLGPPPGFSSVPSRPLNTSVFGSDPRIDGRPLGAYQNLLNGYQAPLANNIGRYDYTNASYDHLQSLSNRSSLSISGGFPFPGKQVPSLHVQGSNANCNRQFDIVNQMHDPTYPEQQQQPQHQYNSLAGQQPQHQYNSLAGQQPQQQYDSLAGQQPGQSSWSGRYPV